MAPAEAAEEAFVDRDEDDDDDDDEEEEVKVNDGVGLDDGEDGRDGQVFKAMVE
jgi:hypothetical protein